MISCLTYAEIEDLVWMIGVTLAILIVVWKVMS